MLGTFEGGGETLDGYFLCNENGEVWDLSNDASTHKYLIADDTFAPEFEELIGKSIAEAKAAEWGVYEQITGEGSTTFETIPVPQDINDFVIQGNVPLPAPPFSDKIQFIPCGNKPTKMYVMYDGKLISQPDNNNNYLIWFNKSAAAQIVNAGSEWNQWKSSLASVYPRQSALLNGFPISEQSVINYTDVPSDAIPEFANIPVIAETV